MKDPEVERKLGEATIGIAGAGGLGSNAAVALARAGVGRMIIVDFDKVERNNLNRQYYFLDQVGKPKVDALKDNIMRAGSCTIVEPVKLKLEKGKMHEPFEGSDVIIEALDDARSKADLISDIHKNLKSIPVIGASGVAGYGGNERINLEIFDSLYLVQDHSAKSSDDEVLLGPKVGLFAHYQANQALEIILGGSR